MTNAEDAQPDRTDVEALLLWSGSSAWVEVDGPDPPTNRREVVRIDLDGARLDDNIKSDAPHFFDGGDGPARAWKCRERSLEIRRSVYLPGTGRSEMHPRAEYEGARLRVASRITLTNVGDEPAFVRRLTPFHVSRVADLGFRRTGEWIFVRCPRMKNDMPASVRVGEAGPAAWDAARGISETGGVARVDGASPPGRFVSSEATVIAGPSTAVCVGYVPVSHQLVETEITVDGTQRELESIRSSCLCDGARLAPGESISSQWFVMLEADKPETALSDYAELLRSAEAPRPTISEPPPSVWCSWYYYGDGMTEEELLPNLAHLGKSPLPIDVVQIDECWDRRWGDWFPNADWGDMASVASRIAALGYQPGLWTCPFLAEPRSHLRYHRDPWLLRTRSGGYADFPMGETRAFVLDPTNPEVLDFLESTYHRLTSQWGFTYHKIDFTRAVAHPDAAFADPTKNRAQAYRMGLEAIRRGIGDESYLNVCGGLYGPSFGIADAQRSGSDVKGHWPTPESEDPADPYGPFTIKQNTLRFWMNRLWHNDPDAMMVRRRPDPYRGETLSIGTFTDDEAETIALNQYLGGGIVCFTENLPEVESDRLELLASCVPSVGAAARPRRLLRGERFVSVYDTVVTPNAPELREWHTVSIVNWFGRAESFEFSLDSEVLGDYAATSARFVVTEYHSDSCRIVAAGETIHTDPVPPHGCRVYRIEALRESPMLVGTDGHYSMGGREIRSFTSTPDGVRVTGQWPWRRPLTIRVLFDLDISPTEMRSVVAADTRRGPSNAHFAMEIRKPPEDQ